MADARAAATSNEEAKPEAGTVQRHQFKRDLLRHRHHDLLQLGFGSQADQPDLTAGHLLRQMGGFKERVAGPGVQDRGQHHLVLQRRPSRANHRFQGL